jgi:hypothetical protein
LQTDVASNDELNRKIAEQRGGQSATVLVPKKPEGAAIAPPVSRAQAARVFGQAAWVYRKTTGSVEVLNYTLDDKGTVNVHVGPPPSKVMPVPIHVLLISARRAYFHSFCCALARWKTVLAASRSPDRLLRA